MASTAAPSVFGSHQIGNGHYIDCATVCTPLSTIKNIFRMVENPDNTKIELLFFGAGFVADDSWNADLYRNQGLLEIINDWSSSLGYGNLKQDMREIEADYGDRVQITFIDTPVPKTYKNEIFLHDYGGAKVTPPITAKPS